MRAHVFYVHGRPYAYVFETVKDGDQERLAVRLGIMCSKQGAPVLSGFASPDDPEHREAWWIATEHFMVSLRQPGKNAVPYRLYSLFGIGENRYAAYLPAVDDAEQMLLFKVERDECGKPDLVRFASDFDRARATRHFLNSLECRFLAAEIQQDPRPLR